MAFPVNFLPHQTERLILRRFTAGDIDPFLSYRCDPQVARYQSWSVLSYDEAQSFIDEMNAAVIGIPGEWFQIAIARRKSNLLIGDIGIQIDANEPETVEIGITLDRKAQGKGYAQEAIQAMIGLLFESGKITKIVGITDIRNQPSIQLLTRIGMSLTASSEVEFQGKRCVEHTFELQKSEWLLHQAD